VNHSVNSYFSLGKKKFAKDASNGLSHEKMIYNINKTHPRVIAKDHDGGKVLIF